MTKLMGNGRITFFLAHGDFFRVTQRESKIFSATGFAAFKGCFTWRGRQLDKILGMFLRILSYLRHFDPLMRL